MSFQNGIKFQSIVEFREFLPVDERIIVDALRDTIKDMIPASCREKLTYNVPFYYGRKRICLIWPASVPWGGFKKGVMLGFCQGHLLADKNYYLLHGNNKRIFYRTFQSLEDIHFDNVVTLLKEALDKDNNTR